MSTSQAGDLKQKSKKIVWILQFGISIIALVYVFWGIDFALLCKTVKNYSIFPMLAVFSLVVVCYCAQVIRLSLLFRPRAPFWGVFKGVFVGLGLNNVLPAKGGDLVKVFYIGKSCELSTSVVLGAVFFERFFDANCLFLLAVALFYIIAVPGLKLFGLSVVFIAIWTTLIFFRLYPEKIALLSRKVSHPKISSAIERIVEYISHTMIFRQLLLVLFNTFVVWGTYALFMVSAILYVADMPLSFSQAFVVFVISAIGQLIPSSPGSLGVFEASFVLGLGWFGIAREAAVALALFIRILQYFPTIVAAFILIDDSLHHRIN